MLPERKVARTLILQVPPFDWASIREGRKREFRSNSLIGKLQLRDMSLPQPVWAISEDTAGVAVGAMMVLEECWEEQLMAISEESLAWEGFDSIAEFKRYWILRTGKRFPALRFVQCYRVRPWDDFSVQGGDKRWMGAALLVQLYGHLTPL